MTYIIDKLIIFLDKWIISIDNLDSGIKYLILIFFFFIIIKFIFLFLYNYYAKKLEKSKIVVLTVKFDISIVKPLSEFFEKKKKNPNLTIEEFVSQVNEMPLNSDKKPMTAQELIDVLYFWDEMIKKEKNSKKLKKED